MGSEFIKRKSSVSASKSDAKPSLFAKRPSSVQRLHKRTSNTQLKNNPLTLDSLFAKLGSNIHPEEIQQKHNQHQDSEDTEELKVQQSPNSITQTEQETEIPTEENNKAQNGLDFLFTKLGSNVLPEGIQTKENKNPESTENLRENASEDIETKKNKVAQLPPIGNPVLEQGNNDSYPPIFTPASPIENKYSVGYIVQPGTQDGTITLVNSQTGQVYNNKNYSINDGFKVAPDSIPTVLRADGTIIKYEVGDKIKLYIGDKLLVENTKNTFNDNENTPNSPQQYVTQFKILLKSKALQRLEENKQRLQSARNLYSPKNPKSSQNLENLRQIVEKDKQLAEKYDEFNKQIGNNQNLIREVEDEPDASRQIRNLSKEIEKLESKLEIIKNARASLRLAYPALAVPDVNKSSDAVGDNVLTEKIIRKLDEVEKTIDEARSRIEKDDIPLTELGLLVDEAKQEMGIEDNSQDAKSEAVLKFLKEEKAKADRISTGTAIASLIFAVAALFTKGLTAIISGALGAGVGLGGAAYEFERADDLYIAAKAGDLSGKPLVEEPETVRFNYIMGWVNVVLSTVDAGLSVTEGASLLKGAEQLANADNAGVLAKLEPEDIGKFDASIGEQKLGKVEEANSIRNQLRDKLGDKKFNQLSTVFETATTTLAKAREWAANVLKIPAKILQDLTLDAIKRLKTLPSWAKERFSLLNNEAKRRVLGCNSPCNVDLQEIQSYLKNLASDTIAGAKKIESNDDIIDAIPNDLLILDKIKFNLGKSNDILAIIKQFGFTDLDFKKMRDFISSKNIASGKKLSQKDSYDLLTQYLSALVPSKIGKDLNKFLDATKDYKSSTSRALRGSMFENFSKMYVDDFNGLDRAAFRIPNKEQPITTDLFDPNTGTIWELKYQANKLRKKTYTKYVPVLGKLTEEIYKGQKVQARKVNFVFATRDMAKENYGNLNELTNHSVYYLEQNKDGVIKLIQYTQP